MNLITKKEIAQLAGVSAPAISKAIKDGRLECYQGSKQIDTDSPLARAYLNNIPLQRQNNVPSLPGQQQANVDSGPNNDDLTQAVIKVQNAEALNKVEAAEFKRQQRIEKEMKNAVRRSDLLNYKKVDQYIFLYLDKLHSNLERLATSVLDDMSEKILESGSVRPEHRQIWKDAVKKSIHESVEQVKKRLKEIMDDQARG